MLWTRSDGTRLRLGDVATVVDGFEETDQAAKDLLSGRQQPRVDEDPRREQALEAEPAESDVRDDLDDPEVAPGERPQVIVTHSAAEAAASLSFDGESAGLDQEVASRHAPLHEDPRREQALDRRLMAPNRRSRMFATISTTRRSLPASGPK